MAHADKLGHVDIHPRAIAEEVGLSTEQVRAALDELEAPDPESRSPEEDGRRIVRLDAHRAWGWSVVNYLKYRAIKSEDDRREQNRASQQAWREKHKQVDHASAAVSKRKQPSALDKHASAASAHTEAEGDTEKDNPPHPPENPGGSRFSEFWEQWPKHHRKVARPQCLKKWQALGCDALAEQVLTALNAAKRSNEWAKDGGEFIPSPLVWLNQARWESPIETEALVAGPSPTAWRHSGQGCQDRADEMGIKQERGEFDEQFRARVFKTWERRQMNHQGTTQ